MIPDENDIGNAQFGDRVYFTEEYDNGNVLVPENMGAIVRNDPTPDEIPVAEGHHLVEIDYDGRYYVVEAPYEILAMQ